MAKHRTFPFVPKSSRSLQPGDFWAIPLADGSFACGRVIAPMPPGMPGAMRAFLGGLLNWHGSNPPTFESISSCHTIEQAVMHIRAITTTGGEILGHRDLALDGRALCAVIDLTADQSPDAVDRRMTECLRDLLHLPEAAATVERRF